MTSVTLGYILGALLLAAIVGAICRGAMTRRNRHRQLHRNQYLNITDES